MVGFRMLLEEKIIFDSHLNINLRSFRLGACVCCDIQLGE